MSKNLERFLRGRNKDGSIKQPQVAERERKIAEWTVSNCPEARKAYRLSREMVHDTDPAPSAKGVWAPKGRREVKGRCNADAINNKIRNVRGY